MARPSSFNTDTVLENAMNLFWLNGYVATGMSALVAETGLKPGSIYGSFGSKQELFEQTLARYSQNSLENMAERLNHNGEYLENIRRFLENLIDLATNGEGKGCFLVNSLLELANDVDLKKVIEQHLVKVERLLTEVLKKAQDHEQLNSDEDPATLAKFILVNIWGIRVLEKAGISKTGAKQLKARYRALIG